MRWSWAERLPLVLVLAGGLLLLFWLSQRGGRPAAPLAQLPPATATPTAVPPSITPTISLPPTETPTRTPEPLLPSRTPTAAPVAETAVLAGTAVAATPSPTVTPSLTATAAPASTNPTLTDTPFASEPRSIPSLSFRRRFGIGVLARYPQYVTVAHEAGLPIGMTLNWVLNANPPRPGGAPFWQMVHVSDDGLRQSRERIAEVAAAQPSSVWLIGNEPDVVWQDNTRPENYAIAYHDAYHTIKELDPTALVAIGGVSQPTPLRRAYLDIVLNTYRETYGQPLPVDIFNVHAFILREEAGSWGVGIPPGMGSSGAMLYEIDDHDDLAIFADNLIAFRAWMAARGYGDRPLVVSEYGILMPPEYGFPTEAIAAFMTGTFDFFLSAANATGYPGDGGRLVQWWFWYSLYDEPDYYPTGNLYDPATGQLTELGRVYAAYVNR